MSTLLELQQATGGELRLPEGDAAEPAARRSGPRRPTAAASSRVASSGSCPARAGTAATSLRKPSPMGAAGVVVDRPVTPPPGRWTLQVADTFCALWQWAAWKRQQFQGTVIAVTGSVGKTTTRQMIHAVLQSRLRGSASPRNYNNHVGLPLSMFQMEPEHQYAVLELGASAQGEIRAMADLCLPRIGVITQHRRRPPGRRSAGGGRSPNRRANCSPPCPPTAMPCWATTRGCGGGAIVAGPDHLGRPRSGLRHQRRRRTLRPRQADFPHRRLPVRRAGLGTPPPGERPCWRWRWAG